MCIIINRLSWWAKLYLLISPNESFDKCHKFRYIFLICTCIYSSNITNCDDYIIWGMWETYLTLLLFWLEESIRIGSSEIVFHCSSEIVTLYLNRKDVKFLHMFISLHKFQMHTQIDFILLFFFHWCHLSRMYVTFRSGLMDILHSSRQNFWWHTEFVPR